MTCQKIHWIEFLFKHCQLYMILVTKTQLAIWKEKILWKSIIFSQERGLLVISNFDQQKLYLLTKLCPKQCRQHSISCQKCFIDYFTDYSLRHVADFASAWICNSLYCVIEGIVLFQGKLEWWNLFLLMKILFLQWLFWAKKMNHLRRERHFKNWHDYCIKWNSKLMWRGKLQVVFKEKESTATLIFATYKRCALSTYWMC